MAAQRDADVVVLGVGSAGEVVASTCAEAGLRVVAVEAGLVGGECPYLACIPSKSMLLSARAGLSWQAAVRRRDEHAEHRDDREAADRLRKAGVELIRGRGRVVGPGLLEVSSGDPDVAGPEAAGVHGADLHGADPHDAGPVRIRFAQLVLATGSEPMLPGLDGIEDVPVWTSDQALSSDELPERLVVLGGGPVGCELAQVYARFGSRVTLVESADRLLAGEPAFVGELLEQALAADGVQVRTGVTASAVQSLDGGGVRLLLDGGDAVEADRLLVATGRRPRLSGLGLDRLGVDEEAPALGTDEHGRVHGGLWAAGDLTGVAPYTHTATYQGRVIAANLLGRPRRMSLAAVPRAVYTDPSVLSVGLTPESAAKKGTAAAGTATAGTATAGTATATSDPGTLVAGGADLAETARGFLAEPFLTDRATGDPGAPGARGGDRPAPPLGRVEVYADRDTGVVLGAAAVAPNAEDLMGQAILAVRAGVTVELWQDTVQPFPAFSEVLLPVLDRVAAQLRPAASGTAS